MTTSCTTRWNCRAAWCCQPGQPKAAMSEALADSHNAPDSRLETLYRRWGRGGYGLFVTGNVMVDRTQLGEPGNVVIEDDRELDALTRWAKAAHDGGVPILVQLNHPGRQSNPFAIGHVPKAPSAVPLEPARVTHAARTDRRGDRDIIGRFVTAATVCETAGLTACNFMRRTATSSPSSCRR